MGHLREHNKEKSIKFIFPSCSYNFSSASIKRVKIFSKETFILGNNFKHTQKPQKNIYFLISFKHFPPLRLSSCKLILKIPKKKNKNKTLEQHEHGKRLKRKMM
jgi:hypothetical protein